MSGRGKLGSQGGFTLLETLLALSIAAVAGVFFAGFLIPQMELYHMFDRSSQGKTMCGQAYMKLEEALRYGYMYAWNEEEPERIFYFTRESGPGRLEERARERSEIPDYRTWPSLTAGDLDIRTPGGMELQLNFEGTTAREVKVRIEAVTNHEVVYEQEGVIRSLYNYDIGEGRA